MNMSYCRFRNTLRDLTDCHDGLEELFQGQDADPSEPLSDDELRAAKALVAACLDIVRLVGDQAGLDVAAGEDDDTLESTLDEIFAGAQQSAKESVEDRDAPQHPCLAAHDWHKGPSGRFECAGCGETRNDGVLPRRMDPANLQVTK